MASEPPKDGQNLPNPNDAITSRGPEFTIGFDTERKWVTGVQTFVTGPTTLVVFREQNLMDDGKGGFHEAIKNVASVIMPTQVFVESHKQSTELLERMGLINGKDESN